MGVPYVKQRLLVFAIILAAVAAGCASPSPATPAMATEAPTAVAGGPSALSVAVASNDFGVGSPRVPFVLFEGSKPITDAQSISVIAFDLSSGTPTLGWKGSAIGFNDYN